MNYYKNKLDWIGRTEARADWEVLAQAVRCHHRADRLHELVEVADRLVGVHYSKWAFTLAMAGLWEVICIDTHEVFFAHAYGPRSTSLVGASPR